MSEFTFRNNLTIELNAPKEEGILPPIPFELISNAVNDNNPDKVEGIVPVRVSDARPIELTLPSAPHITYGPQLEVEPEQTVFGIVAGKPPLHAHDDILLETDNAADKSHIIESCVVPSK